MAKKKPPTKPAPNSTEAIDLTIDVTTLKLQAPKDSPEETDNLLGYLGVLNLALDGAYAIEEKQREVRYAIGALLHSKHVSRACVLGSRVSTEQIDGGGEWYRVRKHNDGEAYDFIPEKPRKPRSGATPPESLDD